MSQGGVCDDTGGASGGDDPEQEESRAATRAAHKYQSFINVPFPLPRGVEGGEYIPGRRGCRGRDGARDGGGAHGAWGM
jgi:hypothetical protein